MVKREKVNASEIVDDSMTEIIQLPLLDDIQETRRSILCSDRLTKYVLLYLRMI